MFAARRVRPSILLVGLVFCLGQRGCVVFVVFQPRSYLLQAQAIPHAAVLVDLCPGSLSAPTATRVAPFGGQQMRHAGVLAGRKRYRVSRRTPALLTTRGCRRLRLRLLQAAVTGQACVVWCVSIGVVLWALGQLHAVSVVCVTVARCNPSN